MASVRRINAIWAKQIADLLEARGRQSSIILRGVGLDPSRVRKEGARIPYAKHVALLDAVAYHLDDTCFGLHLDASIDPLDAGAVAFVAANSPNLGRALTNFVTYLRTLNDATRAKTETNGSLFRLIVEVTDPDVENLRQAHESMLAAAINLSRVLVGKRINPDLVEFQHDRKQEIEEFERYFRCPVKFGCRRNALTLSKLIADMPCEGADPRLLKILKAHCDELLAKLGPEANLKDQVEHLIASQLTSGSPTTQGVARELGMSERTFARRLAERGTTFGQTVDDVRRHLAERFIREPGARSKQIAFMLGYSEPATFTNAFRRWTGQSPTEYRAEAS